MMNFDFCFFFVSFICDACNSKDELNRSMTHDVCFHV